MTSAQIAIMATIILYLCLVIFTGVMIGKRSKKSAEGFYLGGRGIGPLVTAMEGLGSCMAPLSMLVIGILFSELDLKRVLCQGRIYWVAGLRLLVYPLLSMAVLLALRVLWPHSDGDNVLLVSLLCAIGPAASAITQMAQLYHNPNSGYVSSINVLTTLLCAVTMPVMVLLFQLGLDLL